MDPQLAVRQWRNQHRKRDAIRAVILERDPVCTLRILCNGDTSTTVDHVVPLIKGGEPFEISNCRGACLPCNVSRGDGNPARQRRNGVVVRQPTRVSDVWR